MFGLDNNVLLGLVGVVVVFCLLTNKKSFKSLMKKDMLVIVGLTLLLACCMAKGGRVVEGWEGASRCTEENMNIGRFFYMIGSELSVTEDGLDVNPDVICNLDEDLITDVQCTVNAFVESGMGGMDLADRILDKLEIAKTPMCRALTSISSQNFDRAYQAVQIFVDHDILSDHDLFNQIVESNITYKQMQTLAEIESLDQIRTALRTLENARVEKRTINTLQDISGSTGMGAGALFQKAKVSQGK